MPDSGDTASGVTEKRKGEHVDIVIKENVRSSINYWDDISFIHNSLPEFDFDSISLETTFLGKKIAAPIVISGMTGGFDRAKTINNNLAAAASELRIPMGVGSQRAALEKSDLAYTYSVIRDYDIPIRIANIGAPQLVAQGEKRAYGLEEAKAAMEMVGAHLLAIHLNYLQEVVQPEGDRKAAGVLAAIRHVARQLPVMAKETGAGISAQTASRLKGAGVKAIDVGGLGGTSWSAVESYRSERKGDAIGERLGRAYWNWGIPTPVSIMQAKVGLPVVATGGIRNGLDAAKAICLGASAAGLAGAVIKQAAESREAVISEVTNIIEELKVAMFLTASRSVSQLAERDCVITGTTKEWTGIS